MRIADCGLRNAERGVWKRVEAARRARIGRWAWLIVEKIPFFGLSAASSVVTVLVQKAGGAMVPLAALPMGARILNAMDGYLRYCGHVFWPTDLAAIYTFSGRTATETALAGLLVIVVTFVAVWRRQRQPYLLLGWGWFLGTLVPVIGLVQVGDQAIADRYTYLPAIGLFIALAWGAEDLASRWPRRRLVLASAAAAALAACALIAGAQLVYWQDTQLLFRHALKANKDNYVAWSGLGYYLAEQGELRQAEACYRRAVEINPSFAEAWNGLGYTLSAVGRYDEAITSFETAVRLAPKHLKARDNLATTLAACGRLDEAKAQCVAACQVDAKAAEPHSNLGALLAREGKWEEAVAEFRAALNRDPLLDEACCGLAGALAKQGKFEDAIRGLSELLKLQPADSPARLQLGIILALQGNVDQAIGEFSALLRTNPKDSAAHYHLALAFSAQKRPDDALRHYRAAVEARPDFPEALNNLAWMLATQPDPQAARRAASAGTGRTGLPVDRVQAGLHGRDPCSGLRRSGAFPGSDCRGGKGQGPCGTRERSGGCRHEPQIAVALSRGATVSRRRVSIDSPGGERRHPGRLSTFRFA